MKLIVGLGNPGKEYEKTRHNAGFMIVDGLATKHHLTFTNSSKFQAEVGELAGRKATLMKPTTFMNLSGEAVKKFIDYHKLAPDDVWVISDDIDLPLGTIRVREQCDTGGHNGLKSIDQALSTQSYWHIRIGIAPSIPTNNGDVDLHDRLDTAVYVLQPFEERERSLAEQVKTTAVAIIEEAVDRASLINHSYRVSTEGQTPSP